MKLILSLLMLLSATLLYHRYDPSVELSADISRENLRVDFLKNVSQILVRHRFLSHSLHIVCALELLAVSCIPGMIPHVLYLLRI